MEPVFRALAAPSRRALLDRLRARDGQTLEELCEAVPGMTRFGVMKHLRVLEQAGLVVVRKAGRHKYHYLNAVPVRMIHDRWLSKYRARTAGALTGLKRELEEQAAMELPKHVYEIYIRATAEQLWDAITRPEWTEKYYYGTRVESDWRKGSAVTYTYPGGRVAACGEVLEIDRPRRLVMTFDARWDQEVSKDRPHRMTYELTPMGETCRLVVTEDGFEGLTKTYESVVGGTSVIFSGLKTVLETGRSMALPVSQR
jgi:uncharacterized protein YndB with AHSA1/START domain